MGLGPENVVNGGFDSDDGSWTTFFGIIADSVFTFSGYGSTEQEINTLKYLTDYLVSFEIVSNPYGRTLSITFGGNGIIGELTEVGIYDTSACGVQILEMGSKTINFLSSGSGLQIDNVSIKEMGIGNINPAMFNPLWEE